MFFIKVNKKIYEQKVKEAQKPKGFTLLFSILVSTLVLAVGASVVSIALRQLVISGTGRDSQYAFYAANTGVECALYWDSIGGSHFATSSDSTDFSGPMYCLGINIADLINNGDDNYGVPADKKTANQAETKFRLEFEEIGPDNEEVEYCTDVVVKKEKVTNPTTSRSRIKTTIISSGYNTCDTTNPRRIERGLEVIY
jgi:hypothetical protein